MQTKSYHCAPVFLVAVVGLATCVGLMVFVSAPECRDIVLEA